MNIAEPTEESRENWKAWVAARPAHVRAVIERHGFQPWKLYRMKSTGHRVTIAAFDEQKGDRITMRVNVTGEFNLVQFERQVFGVDPNDLEECDLPDPAEPLGSLDISVEEVRALIGRSKAAASKPS